MEISDKKIYLAIFPSVFLHIMHELPTSPVLNATFTSEERARKSLQELSGLGRCCDFSRIPTKRNWRAMNKGRR